jgi:hypothetical protein
LEKDAVAGTIEGQFEQLPDEPEIKSLLAGIDQVWRVNTAVLRSENVIFANQVMPPIESNGNLGSLNLQTGRFWRVSG